MHCPKCESYTTSGRLQGVEVDLCPSCQGVWLDRGELSQLVGTDKDLSPTASGMKDTSYACPRCHQTLTEVAYPWERRILVDVCAACEGIWLDAGELDKISKAAGELRERFPSKRIEKLQHQNRRKEALSSVYGVKEPAAKAPASSRAAFLVKVYGLFVASLGVTVAGVVFGRGIHAENHFWLWVFAGFATLFLAMAVRKVPVLNLLALFAFTFIEGLSLTGVITRYLGTGKSGLIIQALLITTGVFLSLSAYIWVTKKDLTGWGPWLFGALLSLVFSGLMMLVFGTPLSWMVWTWASAVIFSGYVLYDTSRILLKDETDEYISACLDLYLDFLNLFLDILRILDHLDPS